MNRLLQQTLFVIAALILALIVVHAPISVFFGSRFPEFSLLIKSWKELLMLVGVVVIAAEVTRRHRWALFTRDWLFYITIGYVCLHLASLLWFRQSVNETLSGLAVDLRYAAYFALVYGLLKLYPEYRARLVRIAVIGAAVVLGFACLQLVLPADTLKYLGYNNDTIAPYLTVDQNQDLIRVNSTLRGPNPLGAYAVMALALVLAAWIRLRGKGLRPLGRHSYSIFMVLAMVSLWISYSRSALAAGVVAVLVVLAAAYGKRIPKAAVVSVIITLILAIAAMFAFRSNSFVSNVFWHDNPADTSAVNSNEGHFTSLAYGFDRMVAQPFGVGVGTTGSASLLGDKPLIIENQYLFIAHEVGWLGLALFGAMFIGIMMRLWQRRQDYLALGLFASGIGLALIGLLLPVWADDTVSIVWWGLVGISLAAPLGLGAKDPH